MMEDRATFERGREIARELTTLKAELGRLRLLKTMHALDEATRAIGYELEQFAPSRPDIAQKEPDNGQ